METKVEPMAQENGNWLSPLQATVNGQLLKVSLQVGQNEFKISGETDADTISESMVGDSSDSYPLQAIIFGILVSILLRVQKKNNEHGFSALWIIPP